MHSPVFSARLIHAAICVALIALFVAEAARRLDVRGRVQPWLPFHTSDDFMRALTGSAGGSEKLLQSFAALPPGPAAAIYREEDGGATLLAYVASYLAWPREMQLFAVKEGPLNQAAALQLGPFVGIFYCRVPAPADALAAVNVGEGLILVKRDTAAEAPP